MSTRSASPLLIRLSVVTWAIAVGVGLCFLWSYENAPGAHAAPPLEWPSDTAIHRSQDGFTLVMTVHPQCPCTRASLGELDRLMTHSGGRLKVYVLFVGHEQTPDELQQTEHWRTTAGIPGVTAVADVGGVEARRFRAATSGQTVLYDEHGRAVFSGGITASRGHSGDNAGSDAIFSLINAEPAERSETFVFGCPIFESSDECREQPNERDKH